jgi:hypothetical protein
MQRILQLPLCYFGFLDIVAVGLIDNDTIGHFHNSAFNALQLIPCTGKLYQQKEIDHRVHGSFRLPHPYRFHKNIVEPGRLAKNNGFSCFSGNTTQRTGRRRRTNKCVFLNG